MPNNLAVAVSADVTDLQVKFAVAKAETSALTSEMNKLAKQSAAGIIDPAGQAKLQEVAADLIKARTEAAALGAEFKEMSTQTQGVGSVLEELRGKISTAFQVTGIAAAGEAINFVRETVERLGERATQIHVMSDILGVTTAQFQSMQVAAEEGGTSVETFARAGEKLITFLTEARSGTGTAIEKLRDLGISTEQIADPTFNLNSALEVLKERLLDTGTAEATRLQLLKDLGARSAAAIDAIKAYDGSNAATAATVARLNGLNDQQIQELHELHTWWGEVGTEIANTSSKIVLALRPMDDLIAKQRELASFKAGGASDQQVAALQERLGLGALGGAAAGEWGDEVEASGQKTERAWAGILTEMQKEEMENAKAGVEATKSGTAQRLAALRNYAVAAKQYYGSDSADAVIKANQQIIGEQRSVNEAQKTGLQELSDFGKQINNEIQTDRARLALESAKIDANYVKETEKDLKELSDFAENLDTEVTNKHAQGLKELAALDARGAKDQAAAWKGAISEIEGAEGTFVSNVLSHRKGLGQSLIQLGGQMLTTEVANDVKALTTKVAMGNSEKALEQGGLLYHETVQLMKSRQTAAQQAAQTSAVSTGNAARVAAESSAAAASQATASATGPPLIMADAAKAFAGTYASVAQIPYVGWIMAPGAAAAAESAVMSQVGMASLDTGTNYVPRDMMAQIHEGEAVVPRQYNPAAGGSGAGYSEQHSYNGDVHISAFDAGSMAKMLARPGGRSAVLNAAAKSYRRGAR